MKVDFCATSVALPSYLCMYTDCDQCAANHSPGCSRHECLVRTTGALVATLAAVARKQPATVQVQSYNSAAIAWGALGKPLYATGTRYGVHLFSYRPRIFFIDIVFS